MIKKISNKPNIIFASPPCESWSGADCDGRMTQKIDKDWNWIVKNRSFYNNYNQKCHPVKRRDFVNKERTRLIGESTIGATIEIIEEFKPDIWIIENPATSKYENSKKIIEIFIELKTKLIIQLMMKIFL